MFEIGKRYDLTMLEWSDDGPGPVHFFSRTVTEVEGSLVKFVTPAAKARFDESLPEIPPSEIIINVASLYFVSAKPSEN